MPPIELKQEIFLRCESIKCLATSAAPRSVESIALSAVPPFFKNITQDLIPGRWWIGNEASLVPLNTAIRFPLNPIRPTTIFWWGDDGTSSRVPWRINASNSADMDGGTRICIRGFWCADVCDQCTLPTLSGKHFQRSKGWRGGKPVFQSRN